MPPDTTSTLDSNLPIVSPDPATSDDIANTPVVFDTPDPAPADDTTLPEADTASSSSVDATADTEASTTPVSFSDAPLGPTQDAAAPIPTEAQASSAEAGAPSDFVNTTNAGFWQGLVDKARLTILGRRQKRLDRIMGLFGTHSHIDATQVQLLLRVSNSTATKYLRVLETEGLMHQSVKVGQRVTYVKV